MISKAPEVVPIANGTKSPLFWSVMIPAYNPEANYLEQTLRSVLAQDPGPEQMQIEVVDDCSPKVDVAALVREIAGDRIKVSKTPKNLGLAGCWNTCIERAQGEWVHILHQDDYVLSGFYHKLKGVARQHPEVSLLATRAFFIDKHSIIWRMTERLSVLENGGRRVDDFYYGNPIQCAAVVIRRSFYEQHGGFRPEFTYTLDCEMWVRAISSSGGVVTPDILACYRLFDSSETGRLNRTGEALRDIRRMHEWLMQSHPGFDRRRADIYLCDLAMEKIQAFKKIGDFEAVKANHEFCRNNISPFLRLRWHVKQLAGRFFKR